MAEQIPVLKYVTPQPRKPAGLVVLSVNVGAGVLLTMIGVTIDSLLLFQVLERIRWGNMRLAGDQPTAFGLATLLGTGCLLSGVSLVIGVVKEIKRRRKKAAQITHGSSSGRDL